MDLMVTAVFVLVIALVVVESLERLVVMVATDGLGYRSDAELPRSHRVDVLDPLA